jgi:MFS family permease
MLAIMAMAAPMLMLGLDPMLVSLVVAAFVGGMGIEVFGMGWNLAMQEHVPDEMLSRAYSYDALGSFIAIPVGQLAFGPLAAAFGYSDVLVVSAVVYVAICALVLLSRAVRTLDRVDDVDEAVRVTA